MSEKGGFLDFHVAIYIKYKGFFINSPDSSDVLHNN